MKINPNPLTPLAVFDLLLRYYGNQTELLTDLFSSNDSGEYSYQGSKGVVLLQVGDLRKERIFNDSAFKPKWKKAILSSHRVFYNNVKIAIDKIDNHKIEGLLSDLNSLLEQHNLDINDDSDINDINRKICQKRVYRLFMYSMGCRDKEFVDPPRSISVVNRATLAYQARSVAKGEKSKENITDKIRIAELFDSTQDYTFDFQQFRIFASCGNESSVFKGVFKIEKPVNYISLNVNFEKTRIRDEIPEYAGVYFLKHPPIDISTRNMICFQARSVDESIQTIFLELKPEGKRWMHESFSFCVSSEWQKFVIYLIDTDFLFPETLKCLEEITFVVKPNSFANEDRLAGKLDLAELYIK